MLGAEFGDGLAEGTGAAVVAGVVGQHPADGHAVGGVEGPGPAQESRAGHAALVRQDLDIGQPGVVVYGGMDVVVAWAALTVACAELGGVAAVDAVAAAGAQPAELLDIDVE